MRLKIEQLCILHKSKFLHTPLGIYLWNQYINVQGPTDLFQEMSSRVLIMSNQLTLWGKPEGTETFIWFTDSINVLSVHWASLQCAIRNNGCASLYPNLLKVRRNLQPDVTQLPHARESCLSLQYNIKRRLHFIATCITRILT